MIGAFGPAEESRSRLDWSSASGVLVWFVANAPSVRCRACWSVDVRQASSMSRADRERWARNRHAAQKHHVGASKKESSSRPNRAKRMNAKCQLCPSATGQKAKLDFWLGSRYPAEQRPHAPSEREREGLSRSSSAGNARSCNCNTARHESRADIRQSRRVAAPPCIACPPDRAHCPRPSSIHRPSIKTQKHGQLNLSACLILGLDPIFFSAKSVSHGTRRCSERRSGSKERAV